MKRAVRVVCVGGLILGVVSCSPASSASGANAPAAGGQAVTVTMTDFQFTPADVAIKGGMPVTLTAANKGVIEHNWVVKSIEGTIQIDARGGQTASKTFAPPPAGTYAVVCTIAGHEQAGMVGTLRVE